MMDFDKNTKYFLIAGWSLFFLLILISDNLYAGDNHVHIEQVNGGDDININASQVGTNNEIRFSTDHNNNTFNLLQQIIKYLGFLIGAQVKAGVEMLMVYQIL